MLPNTIANLETSLASRISSSASSLTVASIETKDGVDIPNGTYGITVDQGTNILEHMIVTIAGTTTWTILERGLSVIDGTNDIPANKFAHDRGASVKFTDHAILIRMHRALNGTDTLDNPLEYTTHPPTMGDAGTEQWLADVEFVQETSYAGTVNATTGAKGIVQIATPTESLDGTTTGSSGAALVPSNTSYGTQKVIHTDLLLTYGDTIVAGNILYYDSATDRVKVALATDQAHIDALAVVAYDAGSNGDSSKKVLYPGSKVTTASGLTKGGPVYLSDTGTASATPGTIIKVIGRALSTTRWIFNPTVETPTTTPTVGAIPRGDADGTLSAWVKTLTDDTLTTGEEIDGSTTPQLVALRASDSLLYKADANDPVKLQAIGFVNTLAAITTTPKVIVSGVVGGFSGLTVGSTYYASDTAGSISTTPSTTMVLPIGIAISATQILIKIGKKIVYGSSSTTVNSGVTTDTPVTVGFKPSKLTVSVNQNAAGNVATGVSSLFGYYVSSSVAFTGGTQFLVQNSVVSGGTLNGVTSVVVNGTAGGGGSSASSTYRMVSFDTSGFTWRNQAIQLEGPTTRTSSITVVYIAEE